jgi:hypothetical protein
VPRDDEPPSAWGGLEQDAVPEKTYLDLKKAAQEDAAAQIQRLAEGAEESDLARPPPAPLVEAAEVPRHADRLVHSAAKIIPLVLGVSLLLAMLWAVMPVFIAAENRGAKHTDLVKRSGDPKPVEPWLWVVSEPEGARVEVGGQELGRTPYGAPTGGRSRQIRVRLTLDGYVPWAGEVERDETGHYRLMVDLVPVDPAEVPVEAE